MLKEISSKVERSCLQELCNGMSLHDMYGMSYMYVVYVCMSMYGMSYIDYVW